MWAFFSIFIFQGLAQNAPASELTERILKCDAGLVGQKTCPDAATEERELKKICEDPVAYACAKAPPNGALLTDQCKITRNDVLGASELPEVMGVMDQITASEKQFTITHQFECSFMGPPCPVQLRMKYTGAFQRMTLDAAYTEKRMTRLNDLFAKVKKAALEIVQSSTKLSAAAKTLILNRLSATELRDPMRDFSPCYLKTNGEASTGIYNEPLLKDQNPKISVCLGSMAMLDREDDASIMIALGHEITHSVDPCTLDALNQGGDSLGGTEAYGELLTCLQGKTLHVNAPENEDAFCAEQLAANPGSTLADCKVLVTKVSHCALAAKSTNDLDLDLGNYRHGPGTVNQMAESYSDFFGSQIYAKILQKDSGNHPEVLSADRKMQIMKALGADYASLHGVCLKENTNDEHPPGTIRVLNNILGNQELGKLLCPRFKGKQCAGI